MRLQIKPGWVPWFLPTILFLVFVGALLCPGCSDDENDPDIIVDLRADVNRNGTIDFSDPTEDTDEDSWDTTHGAIFLANIDDDQETCPNTGPDQELAACHDAIDDVVNGENDLLDMARLQTAPFHDATDDANGRLSISEPGRAFVRLFRKTGDSYTIYSPEEELSVTDLRHGIEFRLEALDFVRDSSVWDGYLDVTFSVTTEGMTYEDLVRLRVSPLIFHHHLDSISTAYVTAFNDQASITFRSDLQAALSAASVENPLYEFRSIGDQWTQDFMETAYMSMPAEGGQHIIRVNFRSANFTNNKLRNAGRIVFTQLRGPDMAGAVCYDPAHSDYMDSLNSFGNLEVIPPFSHAGQSWPFGRIIRGSTENYYPDQFFETMLASQQIQLPVSIDTEWLIVGHVDEVFSYVEVESDRGWLLLANDPILAIAMLQDLEAAGYGDVLMFEGMSWMTGQSAEISVSQVLSDPELMDANVWAAIMVDEMKTTYHEITGIGADEIVPIPFLHQEVYGYSLAYQPGTTNSIIISRDHFATPATHGPVINGLDIFRQQLQDTLAASGITTHFVEDWDLYHALWGEIHCGCAVSRTVPNDIIWWESDI